MLDPHLSNPPETLDESRTQIAQLWGIVSQLESLASDLKAQNEAGREGSRTERTQFVSPSLFELNLTTGQAAKEASIPESKGRAAGS